MTVSRFGSKDKIEDKRIKIAIATVMVERIITVEETDSERN